MLKHKKSNPVSKSIGGNLNAGMLSQCIVSMNGYVLIPSTWESR